MDYKKTAEEIVNIVKKDNIISATFCATRLRLIIKDKEAFNSDDVQNIEGVKGVFFNSGQYQIILGTGIVNKVYEEVIKLGVESSVKNTNEDNSKSEDTSKDNQNKFKKFIRIFADVFVSIIPAMVATGLFLGLKGALLNDTLLSMFNTSVAEINPTFLTFISVLTETTFAFLPALVCWSAFKVFGGSQALGIILGLMLVSPALPNAYLVADPNSGVTPIMLFGFIPIVGYQGSILPAFIAGIVGANLEKKLRNIVPNVADILLTPFLTLLIMLFLSLLVIGPVFHSVENIILKISNFALLLPFGIGAFFLGFSMIFIVITGVHHIFGLVELSYIASTGFNPLHPIFNFPNLAVGAACLAITLKSKKKSIKTIGYSATLSSWLGITEPAIFGVNIKYGIKPLVCGSIAAGFSCMLAVVLGVKASSNGVTGIPGTLLYIYDTKQLVLYIAISILTVVSSFLITWFFGVPKEYLEEDKK